MFVGMLPLVRFATFLGLSGFFLVYSFVVLAFPRRENGSSDTRDASVAVVTDDTALVGKNQR